MIYKTIYASSFFKRKGLEKGLEKISKFHSRVPAYDFGSGLFAFGFKMEQQVSRLNASKINPDTVELIEENLGLKHRSFKGGNKEKRTKRNT